MVASDLRLSRSEVTDLRKVNESGSEVTDLRKVDESGLVATDLRDCLFFSVRCHMTTHDGAPTEFRQ